MAAIPRQLAAMYKKWLSISLLHIVLDNQSINWWRQQVDLCQIMVCDHGSSNLFGSGRVVVLNSNRFQARWSTWDILTHTLTALTKTTHDARLVLPQTDVFSFEWISQLRYYWEAVKSKSGWGVFRYFDLAAVSECYVHDHIMIQAIEHFAVLEHSQVDDRSAENLWVRMVQTPFPYGGRLSSSVNTQ